MPAGHQRSPRATSIAKMRIAGAKAERCHNAVNRTLRRFEDKRSLRNEPEDRASARPPQRREAGSPRKAERGNDGSEAGQAVDRRYRARLSSPEIFRERFMRLARTAVDPSPGAAEAAAWARLR